MAPKSVHAKKKKKIILAMNFRGFKYYPLWEVSSPKLYTILVIRTAEGTWPASPALIPRLLPTPRNLSKGPSPRAPFSYGVVSPSGPEFAQVASRTITLPRAVWDQH